MSDMPSRKCRFASERASASATRASRTMRRRAADAFADAARGGGAPLSRASVRILLVSGQRLARLRLSDGFGTLHRHSHDIVVAVDPLVDRYRLVTVELQRQAQLLARA